MFNNPFIIILVTSLLFVPASYTSAQEQKSAPEETALAVPEGEIAVESGQIRIPIRNPFVPKIPVEPKIETTDTEITVIDDDGEPEILERRIEYVEPKITGVPQLYISGMIWDSERPQAIVNGNIVEIGDRLFQVPTNNKETIPELKFVDISKEGLAVAYEDKIVIIKPEQSKE
jgi:hypothetical protein